MLRLISLGCLFTALALLTGCSPATLPQPARTFSPGGPVLTEIAREAAVALTATLSAMRTQAEAARPSETPAPSTTPSIRLCNASDLSADVNTVVAGRTMTFTLTLKNSANEGCVLQGPPQAGLMDAQDFALDVDAYPYCFKCSGAPAPAETPLPATQAALSPNQTAEARQSLYGQMQLGVQETARVLLIWSNWCEKLPDGGVTVRLTLPDDGNLDLPTDAMTGARCDSAARRSTLMVSQYYK